MIRAMLADRSSCRHDRERRDVQSFENLVAARSDGKLGPNLVAE
jgi:hypothetical protein